MVQYTCPNCCLTTDRKSNYERHIKSNRCTQKQLSLCNTTTSIVSELTENDFIDNRILQLENQLKIKDLEIQNLLKTKDYEMQIKDLEINQLKEINSMLYKQLEQQQQQQQNITMSITEKVNKNLTEKAVVKETTMDLLKRERNEVISIEDFIEQYLNNPNINPYLKTAYFGNEQMIVLKDIELHKTENNSVVKQVCKLLDKLPHNQRPIYCSDARRHKFYIFSNGKWVKDNGEIESLIKKIIVKSAFLLSSLLGKMLAKKPKNPRLIYDNYYEENEKSENQEFETYKKQNNIFNAFFKRTYNISFEEWEGDREQRKTKLASYLAFTNDDISKFIDSLKIELSKITTIEKCAYKEYTAKPIIQTDDIEEYDNEKDDEWS